MKLIDNNLKSFHVAGKYPQWLIWLVALGFFGIAWYCVDIATRRIALRDLATYQDNWEADGMLMQDTDYTCVPSSIVMLLRDEGINTTTLEVATIAGTDIRGTSGGGIVRSGQYFGFSVEHRSIGFDEFMDSDLPAILVFRRGWAPHAAYLRPLREYGVIQVKDPSQGLLMFGKDDADQYFGSTRWSCYLFAPR